MLPTIPLLRKRIQAVIADKDRQGHVAEGLTDRLNALPDSFGCTCGSILGNFFGPGHLDPRWLAPFHDEIQLGMTGCFEHSLTSLARRMGQLPRRLADERKDN